MNGPLFNFIHQFASRNIWLDDFGAFVAQYLPYVFVLGFLILAARRKDWRMRLGIFADGAIAIILSRGIITEIIRFFYHHPRPFEALNFAPLIAESGYSFPSGHAAWFFALAMTSFYYNRRLGIWYFVFAVLNGIARVYVGVHWPLDILGGAVAGIFCGVIVHNLLQPILQKMLTEKVN